jgi:hypothetical protein
MVGIIVGGGVKDTIVATAINCHHCQQRCHWRRQLNLTATTVNKNFYCCHQQLLLLLPLSQQRQLPEARVAMAVIVDGRGS